MKFSFFIYLFFTTYFLYSQNIIPNPSFEYCKRPINNWIATHILFEKSMNDWFVPNEGSPDILQKKYLGKFFFKRPKVNLVPYSPKNGDVMIGLKLYGCENGQHCKEYIQTKLKESLKKGKKYYLEFWVKPINTSIKINNIGAYLSVDKLENFTSGVYHINTHINSNSIINPKSADDWVKISDTICVDSNYQYLTIGNFYFDENTEAIIEANGIDYAFYLIDDVLLEDVKSYCNGTIDAKIEDVINVQNIHFKLNSSQLISDSFSELDKLAAFLKNRLSIKIKIEGHTDSSGELTYNQSLSLDRAKSVRDYLLSKGISNSRLAVEGKGALLPITSNDVEEGRELNRRVEITIIN